MNTDNKPIRLLLIDDEDDFRQATSRALTKRGFAMSEASNGEEGLARLQNESPDIVLLDLRMPGMSGIETLEKLRRIHRDLPVIILTGHGSYNDAIAGINLQITDFLQKPVDVEVLENKLRRFLEKGASKLLRESSVAELMVSPTLYPQLYEDQSIKEALALLKPAIFTWGCADNQVSTVRSALVFNRREKFLGVIRFFDLLKLLMPAYLGGSPHSSYFTGMFLAQCKVIGDRRVGEFMPERVTLDIHSPLMEAVHLMTQHRFINLPVLKEGELVGILREKDLVRDIALNLGIHPD